jgi:hypothetical protein
MLSLPPSVLIALIPFWYTVPSLGLVITCNGPALGAQAGETKIREVVMTRGSKPFRRATQTPFNNAYEAVDNIAT